MVIKANFHLQKSGFVVEKKACVGSEDPKLRELGV